MDINELIDNLRFPSWQDLEDPGATLLGDAADALSTLQAENEKLPEKIEDARLEGYAIGIGEMNAELEQEHAHRLHAEQHANAFLEDCKRLDAELKQVKKCIEIVEFQRDAAIKQLHGHCYACAYYTSSHNQGPCSECKYEYYLYPCDAMKDNWEWCGPEEED